MKDKLQRLVGTLDDKCARGSSLPTEVISFNPSDPDSVDEILSKYGPEGAFEIAEVLKQAALADVDCANASLSISGGEPEYAPRTCSALTVEQPTRITEDGRLFFLRGYAGGFGSEYGTRLTRDEYEAELVEQAGPGKLVETAGVFVFQPNDGLEPARKEG